VEEQLAARLGGGQIRAPSIFILSRDHDLRVCKPPCVLRTIVLATGQRCTPVGSKN
jgi:hypothetical protein